MIAVLNKAAGAHTLLTAPGGSAQKMTVFCAASLLLVACIALAGVPAAAAAEEYSQSAALVDLRATENGTAPAAPATLEYDSSGILVTGAQLDSFPFLAISIDAMKPGGDNGAGSDGTFLSLDLSHAVFDPIFDDESYSLYIITDAGPHAAFETSGRNMMITDILTGTDVVDVFVSLKKGGGGGEEPQSSDMNADSSEDTAASPTPPAEPPTDAPPPTQSPPSEPPTDAPAPQPTQPTPSEPPTDAPAPQPTQPTPSEPPTDAPAPQPTQPTPTQPPADAPTPPPTDLSADTGDTGSVGGVPDTPASDDVAPLSEPTQVPEDPGTKCGPGTEMIDGICMLSDTPEPAGQDLAKSGSSRTLGVGAVSGLGAGFLVAGVVAIPLALIARAHRRGKKKTTDDDGH